MSRERNGETGPPDESAPADDAEDGSPAARVLHKIAASLGLPSDTFRTMIAAPSPNAPEHDRPATDDECRELLSAFRRIKAPDVRRQCIAILQSLGRA